MDGIASTPQPHTADQIERFRQAIYRVAAQNGGNNETVLCKKYKHAVYLPLIVISTLLETKSWSIS